MRWRGWLCCLVLGCTKTAAITQPEPPTIDAPATTAVTDGAVAAFVIATDRGTIVAPVVARHQPVRASGIWVLDDAVQPAVVRFHPAPPEDFPTCACAEESTACDGPVVVGSGTGPICECSPPEPPDYDGGYDPEAEDVDEDACTSSEVTPASLVGGTLYLYSDDHDGCYGRNIYDVSSQTAAMVAKPVDASARKLAPEGCSSNEPGGGFPAWPLPESECDREELAAGGSCEPCRKLAVEATTVMLHGGRLFIVEDEVETVGGGPRRWSSVPVTPETCPSAADPCGSPARFRDLAAADDSWVANDGAHALRLDGDALAIVGEGPALARGSTAGATVLGVRYHADARELIASMAARAPRAQATTTCSRDADCNVHVGCKLRCDAGSCTATASTTAVLADEDAGFSDSHGGRDWGTRCIAHLRADRLANAQAACVAGLEIARKDSIRGALLYNLGLIARKAGDTATARQRFRESLQARPRNATVQRALDGLGPE